ncbi:MAG: lipoate--protein ligase family protein, partial [Erysipelotrichia bacterium]|nr:lipoate--protein ligase family protein [Erysipelotrichia bacterium]
MFYLENNCNNPYYNLALEEHILRASNKLPLFFIWINSPSVIIGRFQNTIQEINLSYANDNFINVVRRNSGGGAVYHDLGNINYSFIIAAFIGMGSVFGLAAVADQFALIYYGEEFAILLPETNA